MPKRSAPKTEASLDSTSLPITPSTRTRSMFDQNDPAVDLAPRSDFARDVFLLLSGGGGERSIESNCGQFCRVFLSEIDLPLLRVVCANAQNQTPNQIFQTSRGHFCTGGKPRSNIPINISLNERNTMVTQSQNDNLSSSSLAPDRLRQMAKLIANGEIPIPVKWSDDQLAPLLDLVHAARRQRLMRFFAGVIASDICRSDRQKGVTNNVTEKI